MFHLRFGLGDHSGATGAPYTPSEDEDQTSVKYQSRQKAMAGGYLDAPTDIPSTGASTASYTVAGLDDDVSYAFQVRALDSLHQGSWREVLALTHVPAGSPLIPRGVQPLGSAVPAAVGNLRRERRIHRRDQRPQRLRAGRGQLKALISTRAFNARVNAGAGPAEDSYVAGESVPICWLGGEQVADFYADLYDRSWDSIAAKNELGEDSAATRV